MIRTIITLTIAVATLFVGACQDDMSLAAEAQAHTKPGANTGGQHAPGTEGTGASRTLAATDSESTTGQSPRPSEGPQGSQEEQKKASDSSDQSMTDDQARQLLREDWMEEQPQEAGGTIGEKGESADGSDNAEDTGLRGVVNLNTASMDDLMMLPGVGPATAARISDYRQQRRFTKPEHLKRIKGIGPKTWAKLKPHVAVDGKTTLSE